MKLLRLECRSLPAWEKEEFRVCGVAVSKRRTVVRLTAARRATPCLFFLAFRPHSPAPCLSTGRTAQMVAKYRPPMPILTLVVPRLVNDSLHWKLEGRSTARCCQLTRGLLPMLATPGPNGDAVLEGAVLRAASAGLVQPRGHVVVLQQIGEDYALKVREI